MVRCQHYYLFDGQRCRKDATRKLKTPTYPNEVQHFCDTHFEFHMISAEAEEVK